MTGAPTPYNSIYSYMGPGSQTPKRTKKTAGPCCLHGKDCQKQPTGDEESSPYVNLLVQPKPPMEEEEDEEREQHKLRILEREMKALQLGEESERHKKIHEKKKKQKSRVEKSTESRSIPKKERKKREKRRSKSDVSQKNQKSQEKDLLQASYLGIQTWKEAEAAVRDVCDFRLYHRMGTSITLTELEPSLPLFIVYKSAAGPYKHYRVRITPMEKVTTYAVEDGQMRADPPHPSLEHLINFYRTQFLSHRNKDGQELFDAFPCWSDSN